MGSAAKFTGEITHLDHADFISVFLTKQSHSTGLLCLIQIHDDGIDRKAFRNLFIHDGFYFMDLISSHG